MNITVRNTVKNTVRNLVRLGSVSVEITNFNGINAETGEDWTALEIDAQLIHLATLLPGFTGYTIFMEESVGRTTASDTAADNLVLGGNGIVGDHYEESDAFIITVDTTEAGSASDTFVLPLKSGSVYDFNVDWGDGSNEDVSGSTLTEKSKTYATGGVYQITITGSFPYIYFNNSGDKAKLVSWDNLGDTGLATVQVGAFMGCSLTSLPTDHISYWDSITNGNQMFKYNSLASLPEGMTLNALTAAFEMFYPNNFTSLPDSMTLAALVTANYMFRSVPLTTLPAGMTLNTLQNGDHMFRDGAMASLPSSITFAALTTGNNLFLGCTINTSDYSALLVRIEANNGNTGVTFNGGSSKYNSTGETAKNALINDHTWSFTDGGLE